MISKLCALTSISTPFAVVFVPSVSENFPIFVIEYLNGFTNCDLNTDTLFRKIYDSNSDMNAEKI